MTQDSSKTHREEMREMIQSDATDAEVLKYMQQFANGLWLDVLSETVDVWVPGLYERNPRFFEDFLLRWVQEVVFRRRRRRSSSNIPPLPNLLARFEADGNITLFRELYPYIVSGESAWNEDLHALAQSSMSNAQLQTLVERRDIPMRWLNDTVATLLYQRDPPRFRDFVRKHLDIRYQWQTTYPLLLQAIQQQQDDTFYWNIFRQAASEDEWTEAINTLLQQPVPAERIDAELQQRHLDTFWELPAEPLIALLQHYGSAVVPYIERHMWLVEPQKKHKLMQTLKQVCAEEDYWRIFHRGGGQWHELLDELRDLLARPLSDDALLLALEHRIPPDIPLYADAFGRWNRDKTAEVWLAIYQRNPSHFAILLRRMIGPGEPPLALFHAAEEQGDENMLDFLTGRKLSYIREIRWRGSGGFSWSPGNDRGGNQEYRETVDMLIARFERLVAQSPEGYVRHAASMLGSVEGGLLEWLFGGKEHEENPPLDYLRRQQHETWRNTPDALRDLLEAPHIPIQMIGVDMLCDGGSVAAQRVVENLSTLRALLLGLAKIKEKKRVLACLEYAARQGEPFAAQVLPLLEETMDFRGRQAISKPIMVSFVRLRRELAVPA